MRSSTGSEGTDVKELTGLFVLNQRRDHLRPQTGSRSVEKTKVLELYKRPTRVETVDIGKNGRL